jgi:hypothetical protein
MSLLPSRTDNRHGVHHHRPIEIPFEETMNKTVKMVDTTSLQEIARQGYYFVIRYPNGTEYGGTYQSEAKARKRAGELRLRDYQIVRVGMR